MVLANLGRVQSKPNPSATIQSFFFCLADDLTLALMQVELAKRLVECSFADRVFFANSGTEANEAAIKFARKFQRHSHPNTKEPATEFIAFTNCFHGRTMGALALTSKEHYRTPFQPVMPGVTFTEYGNIEATKKLIQQGKTAAVFVEPIQGEGGIYSASKEFLQFLRKACDDAGALLVFDEVISYVIFMLLPYSSHLLLYLSISITCLKEHTHCMTCLSWHKFCHINLRTSFCFFIFNLLFLIF